MKNNPILALSIICLTVLTIWFSGLRNAVRYQITAGNSNVYRYHNDTGQLDYTHQNYKSGFEWIIIIPPQN